jgi:hypothetical protein
MTDDAADRLVARAIESVLDQVPGAVDTSVPDGTSAKLQPWAETAAPAGRNKRPLEELLVELAERVAADPNARAAVPRTRHPALAFFDRFGRGGAARSTPDGVAEGGGRGTGRRRRRRRGGGAGRDVPASGGPAGQPGGQAERPSRGRRRPRRGDGGAGAKPRGDAAAGGRDVPASGGPAGQPGGGRRRRRRRGRGGGPPAAG